VRKRFRERMGVSRYSGCSERRRLGNRSCTTQPETRGWRGGGRLQVFLSRKLGGRGIKWHNKQTPCSSSGDNAESGNWIPRKSSQRQGRPVYTYLAAPSGCGRRRGERSVRGGGEGFRASRVLLLGKYYEGHQLDPPL